MGEPFWALALWVDVSAWAGQCETAPTVSVKAVLPKSSSVCCCLSVLVLLGSQRVGECSNSVFPVAGCC